MSRLNAEAIDAIPLRREMIVRERSRAFGWTIIGAGIALGLLWCGREAYQIGQVEWRKFEDSILERRAELLPERVQEMSERELRQYATLLHAREQARRNVLVSIHDTITTEFAVLAAEDGEG